MKNGTIFVKRHIGYSSYNTDPQVQTVLNCSIIIMHNYIAVCVQGQLSVLSLAVMSSKQHQFGCVSEKVCLCVL